MRCREQQISQQTTGAYGWLESRRPIYQNSNSAKQVYNFSRLIAHLYLLSILFNIHHPDDLYEFRLRQPHTWCGTPVTIGRGPVAIPADAMAIE